MLRRIASALAGRETRAEGNPPPSNQGPVSQALGNLGIGGRMLHPAVAENLAAVAACVGVTATAVASLPARIYRIEAGTRIETADHPVATLIEGGPNAWQTWPDLAEWLVAQVLLHGNGLVEIVSDGEGRVIGLEPVPWGHVSIQMLGSRRLAYDVVAYQGPFGGTGRMRRLLDSEVLHIRDRSDDGLVGRSRISRAAAALSTSLAVQEFSSALYENHAAPSGALMVDQALTREQRDQLRGNFAQGFSGPARAARALILERGVRWQQFDRLSPEDAELLESRRFSTEEIARIFNVPPPLIQDYSHNTFTNSSAAGRWFAQFTLMPLIRKIEAGFRRSVLGPGHALQLDLSELMRGDDTARWAGHKIAVEAGILDPDEIREQEGWNPRAKGEAA